MQVTETLSEGLKRNFTVVVPATDIASRRAARLADIGKTLKLPGFRPGKVPLPVVRQRFGSAVDAEVLQESLDQATQQVLSERGLRPAVQPKVDVISGDPAGGATGDLEFKVELELMPDITLPDFAGITLTRPRAEVTQETIDKTLATIAQRNRTLITLSADARGDRGAEVGEVLTIDFVGKIDGEAFPGGTATDVDADVAGDGFIPGFTEQLVGLRPGEARTIDVTFPSDYGTATLAGKAASFEITAKALKQATVPPVDDDLAKALGLASLEQLTGLLREQIQGEYDKLTRLRVKRQLLDALAERVQFACPDSVVTREFEQIWARVARSRETGEQDEDDKGKDEATLKAEYHAIAERRVRLGLLLAEIGRLNSIIVSPEELTPVIRAEVARFPGQEQMFLNLLKANPQALESLRAPVLEDKVVDFVLELAQVTDEVVTPEQLSEERKPD